MKLSSFLISTGSLKITSKKVNNFVYSGIKELDKAYKMCPQILANETEIEDKNAFL